jgi:hypothetical protein
MTPEEKLELLRTLLERGVEIRTYYKSRRVVAIEQVSQYVLIRYDDGSTDKLRLQHFASRRFVAVI